MKNAKKLSREQLLHLLIVAGQVTLGVVALVRVGPAPVKSTECQLVSGEGAGARGEAAGDDDRLLTVLGTMLCHHMGMGANTLESILFYLVQKNS